MSETLSRHQLYARKNPDKIKALSRKSYEKRRQSPKVMLSNAKGRAKRANVPFNLTVEDITIPETCPILGLKLKTNYDAAVKAPAANSPSLDRVIPSKGYVRGNVKVISHAANRLKSNLTLQQAELLVKYLKEANV